MKNDPNHRLVPYFDGDELIFIPVIETYVREANQNVLAALALRLAKENTDKNSPEAA